MDDIRKTIYNSIMESIVPIVAQLISETTENIHTEEEGFSFNKDKTSITFDPKAKNKYADTDIFKDGTHEFKVRKIELPKSKVISYNLYNIENMNINKALKHKTNSDGKAIEYNDLKSDTTNASINSIDYFINRSALYIKSLLKDQQVDIITYPQTSKNSEEVGFESFNNEMTKRLMRLYPQSEGIKLMPEILIKNVKNIFVNVDVARSLGLSNDEIHKLQLDIEKWKSEEDIIAIRKRIDVLEEQIALVLATRGKGRPSNDFKNKQQEVELLKQQIKLMKQEKKIKGRDRTKDSKTGKAKEWQIKSLPDKQRRAIEGIFELNPKYKSIQYKFKGKHIVIFDDNLSSGATLDDVCLALQTLGVASITAITIGVIPATVYGPERYKQHNAEKLNFSNMDWYFSERSTDWDY